MIIVTRKSSSSRVVNNSPTATLQMLCHRRIKKFIPSAGLYTVLLSEQVITYLILLTNAFENRSHFLNTFRAKCSAG
uniref:Uncharacterized protein n=1 Tax=Octopus bimaculoides TaxID=37653 RepID=A0A0L8GZY0_OCTBM